MTNHSLYVDDAMSDESRRAKLYQGQLFVYSSREPVRRFAKFARELIEDAFGSRDPQTAQHETPVEEFAELLGELKPRFIHYPESKRHGRASLEDLGCNPELIYFDVPLLRSSTSDQYLTHGIAYAWHPHSDTWHSAPPCQVNFGCRRMRSSRTTRWCSIPTTGTAPSPTIRTASTTTPGTTMRDYLRCTDLERLPDDTITLYDDSTVGGGEAIYKRRTV
jgi:hypothetical protein